MENFRKLPCWSLYVPLRSSQCCITLYAYSVVICIGVNPQRLSFNYPRKITEQFYKYQSKYVKSLATIVKKYIFINLDTNRYVSDICSLDTTKNIEGVSQKHCLATKIILKLEINHVKYHINKSHSVD